MSRNRNPWKFADQSIQRHLRDLLNLCQDDPIYKVIGRDQDALFRAALTRGIQVIEEEVLERQNEEKHESF